uniref:uncharacterized protein LOC114581966 n=1 Tax=Podarcis muralis TaxID=64176 RepID=UPI00109F15D0|nr:uncharacterized protein LOC114581966 [Podarcis muralis]
MGQGEGQRPPQGGKVWKGSEFRAVDWENLQQPSGAGKPSEIRSFSERKDNAAVVAPGITGSRGPKRLLYRRAQMDKGVTAMEDVGHASRDEAPAPATGMKNRTTSQRFPADVPRGVSPLSLLRTGMAPSRPSLAPWLALSTDVDSLAGPQLWSPDDIFCCELLVGNFLCFHFPFWPRLQGRGSSSGSRDEEPDDIPWFPAAVPHGESPLPLLRTGMAPSRPGLAPWLALSTDVDSLAGP